jgi:Rieske Fe-S protein
MVEDDQSQAQDATVESDEKLNTDARRHFLKGGIAVAAGLILLSIGAFDKVFRFFFGPRLTEKEETVLLQAHVKQSEGSLALQKLELERGHDNYIFVAALADLDQTTGKYFIDYDMGPALAFLGSDGLPDLLSAKCTHLGCTVGNQVNDHGQVLCPCHVSYFDIKTGAPSPGSPAKTPLPHLGWVLMDKQKKVLASRSAAGEISGDIGHAKVQGADVYIQKTVGTTVS